MFINIIARILAFFIIIISTKIAYAEAPTFIQQFQAWGSYYYNSKQGKICYIVSVPVEKAPASVDHGKNFFIVSQKPGNKVSYEPQLMAGYNLYSKSKVTVQIDSKKFIMFTRDKGAWLENAAEEPQLINAMKTGKKMNISAKSGRGTTTTYSYSLEGISAALKNIKNCK
ncbi:Mlr4354 like protein [Liberibacter crescens BT-1]|uniref:Mlr4354 like protein n=1 Tax=Liberibacter crescens (strain BT-1) TaxID=1215343 RepID=L0EW64_LIBCB|nr:invasion associated locus B family protein [Liberibacter crescens]AGA64611.1 Mlr4354 like protein [Liberibacter crescens BT-1]AMC12733.1 signal peptide protein [Liberibacter crescens]